MGNIQTDNTYRIPHDRGDPEPLPVLGKLEVAVDEPELRGRIVKLSEHR